MTKIPDFSKLAFVPAATAGSVAGEPWMTPEEIPVKPKRKFKVVF